VIFDFLGFFALNSSNLRFKEVNTAEDSFILFADDSDAAVPFGFFLDPKIRSLAGAGVCAADLRPERLGIDYENLFYLYCTR
jgi:hypothetical protein